MSELENYDIDKTMDIIREQSDGLYIVDIDNDVYRALQQSEQFKTIFGDDGKYSDMFRVLMFHFNKSPDQIIDGYLKFIPEVKSFNGKYGRVIKIFNGDEPIVVLMGVYPLSETGKYLMMLTSLDDCEYMEDVQTKAKEAVIQEGYLFTMYVNLDEDLCYSIDVTEMDSASQKYNNLKYSKWRNIIVNMIHIDDKAMFISNTEPEYIKNRLKNRKSMSFECQMQNLQGVYKWIRLTFSKIQSLIDNEFKFVYMVQDIHESSIRLLRDVKKLEDISNHDALTGVYNHGKIEDELYRYVELGKSKTGLLSLMMLDIDYFKNTNDTYGHAIGDEVLRNLSSAIMHYTQNNDIVIGRWGGDEFFGICDNCNIDKTYELAEGLRKLIEENEFILDRNMTCSIGVIEVGLNEAARAAFERVDNALYRAKKSGRNCVVRG